MKVKIQKLEHWDLDLEVPSYQTSEAAGADIRACLADKNDLVIAPGKRVLIPTGLALEIQAGFEIQVRPRSGLSFKTALLVVNSPGTIDSDYRGEIKIIMGNFGDNEEVIKHGDRIAQLVMAPVIQAEFMEVSHLNQSDRGTGGFGSTGKA
jgi:dUTP pyrophosphatase